MTTPELFASLATEQTTALNALLISQRTDLTAAHVAALSIVTANDQAQLAEIARLTASVASAQQEYATAQNQVASLTAQLETLRNPPVPPEAQLWVDFLAGSITDSVTGIALKANRSAKNDFVAMFTLLNAAIAIGAATAETPQEIWDASNVKHELPVGDILALLIRYGFAWQAAFNALAP